MKKKERKSFFSRGLAAVMAFLLILIGCASTILFEYSGIISGALNVSTSKTVTLSEDSEVIDIYYDSEYGTDYTNSQSTLQVELAVASENIKQAEEGAVLLKNEDDTLPLASDSRVTLFGNASYNTAYGSTSESSVDAISTVTISSALKKVLGSDSVNDTLLENVYAGLSATSSTTVVEADIDDVKKYEDTWESDYNDAAIVVFSRIGAESDDTAMYGDDGSHFLDLQANEADLMEYLQQQKEAGVFDRIIVLINSDQMMELGWLEDYDVDACLLVGLPGVVGFEGIANVLVGNTTPSGHLVDTYAYNSLSSPAVTYSNENMQVWGNVDEVNATSADVNVTGENIDYYTIYAEGIYVGYKYYETRYEDTVMQEGNADSAKGSSTGDAWTYSEEVLYTFGYGLSYTTFEQTLQNVTYNSSTDNYEVTVKVTNTGSREGKSVVEVYAQTPYGEYEKTNQIEKASVQIAGFEKTDTLQPGESETVTVEVERYMLASYDENGAEGYILSAGDYYLAIGDDAHDALNNILSAKGYTVDDGMTDNGDASKTYMWTQDELDTTSYASSRYTDADVTNQFDHAQLDNYGIEFTYLSRSDWDATYPEEEVVIDATAEMMEDMDSTWYEIPEDSPSVDDFTQGADNGLSFVDMRLVEWDDDETWDLFLDQLTVEEMTGMMSDARGTDSVDSISMPSLKRADDNLQVEATMLSTGSYGLGWASEVMTSRTWNRERMEERGKLTAIEASYAGVSEIWYGGGNIHRTPFGGRNSQYYSEDGNYGYMVGAVEAAAMQEYGVAYCIKHFALNDQESGREGISVFATEQTIREEYLRAFEGAICEGGALGVMASFNRIGVTHSTVDYSLLTTVLRDEWGFEGHVTTDGYSSTPYKTHYMEMLSAGITYSCLDPGNLAAAVTEAIEGGDGNALQLLRNASKANVYVASRSIATNGLSSDTIVVTIVPWWETALLVATALCALGLIVCVCVCTKTLYLKNKNGGLEEDEKDKDIQ